MRSLQSAIVLVIQIIMTCPVLAIEVEKKDQAYMYFARGEVLFENGEYSKAADAFLLAYETYPHSSTLINVARCYEKAGWYPAAISYYKKYLDTHKNPADKTEIAKELARLMSRVGEMNIGCSFESACTIRIDGVSQGTAPIVVYLEPGRHIIEAESNTGFVETLEVRVDGGITESVTLKPTRPGPLSKLKDIEGQFAHSSENTAPEKTKLRAPFWILGGLTLVSAGVTTALGARLIQVHNEWESNETADLELADKGDKYRKATNVMFGVTGALAATAVVLMILDLRKHREKKRVNAGLGPGAGLSLDVVF